jgi:protein TonB
VDEELLKNDERWSLVYAAAVALVVHGMVVLGWRTISLEDRAYAMGKPGGSVIFIEAGSQPVPFVEPSYESPPIVPPVPAEMKKPDAKRITRKQIEKPIVKPKPEVAPQNERPNAASADNVGVAEGAAVAKQGRPGEGSGSTTSAAQPDYLSNPAPAYPRESRRNREEGTVLVFARISEVGRVLDIKLRKSSGYERLDESAIEAVRDWRFKPARFAGLAVETTVEIPVRFALK